MFQVLFHKEQNNAQLTKKTDIVRDALWHNYSCNIPIFLYFTTICIICKLKMFDKLFYVGGGIPEPYW